MRILVTFAVHAEFALWRRMRRFRRTRWATRPAYVTQIDGAEIGVVLTGVGPQRARQAAFEVMMAEPVDICVSTGLAGAVPAQHLPSGILGAPGAWCHGQKRTLRRDGLLLPSAGQSGGSTVEQ